MKKKKAYILYKYNQFNNDYEYIKEYYNTKDIQKEFKNTIKNDRSIYHYITKSIDNVKQLLNNQYIIISESIEN